MIFSQPNNSNEYKANHFIFMIRSRLALFTLFFIGFCRDERNDTFSSFLVESFSTRFHRPSVSYFDKQLSQHHITSNYIPQNKRRFQQQGFFSTSNFISTPTPNKNSNSTRIENIKQKKKYTSNKKRYNNPRFESHKRSRPQHSYSSDSHHAKFKSSDKRQTIKRMFREAKNMERIGRWRRASQLLSEILIIEPKDAHSHLALARLQSRREQNPHRTSKESAESATHDHSKNVLNSNTPEKSDTNTKVNPYPTSAREAYKQGTKLCPTSIHLWQAWAIYELELGNFERANELFEKALKLDCTNPYVCHAYGLMQQKSGNMEEAQKLWEQSLDKHSTAALVCSLGELYASSGNKLKARELYAQNIPRLKSERERTEVYLAAAWLEERHFSNLNKGYNLIQSALKLSPKNGRVHVALLRLEDRLNKQKKRANGASNEESGEKNTKLNLHEGAKKVGKTHDLMRQRLADLCSNSLLEDGRLFNAWASLEVKDGRLEKARRILKEGMQQFPQDQSVS